MDSNQLKKGEIWFFASSGNKIRNRANSACFSAGHMGISFNRLDFFDDKKKIFAFGPTDYKSLGKYLDNNVNGNILDDMEYFKYFYDNCSNKNDPLFKLNILYSEPSKEKFLKADYTYALPYNKDFNHLYYNCITSITKIIKPLIEFKDEKIQFIDEYNL